jgi:hypothetical protein
MLWMIRKCFGDSVARLRDNSNMAHATPRSHATTSPGRYSSRLVVCRHLLALTSEEGHEIRDAAMIDITVGSGRLPALRVRGPGGSSCLRALPFANRSQPCESADQDVRAKRGFGQVRRRRYSILT